MGTFTTNWYLYKTQLHAVSTKSQTLNPEPATRIFGVEKRRGFNSENREAEKKTKFEEVLLEAIDEGLSLLGDSSKQALYVHLEKAVKMNKLDIPYRIEDFADAIEKLFGAGAKILEIHIMKCLFKKVGYNFKHYPKQKDLTFTDYITTVKLKREANNNIEDQQLNRNQNGKTDNTHMSRLGRSQQQSNWISRTSSKFTPF
ncbi:MAG: hypothetical protein PVH73_10260 [Candidatus Bathyarchaeota archaeon]